MVVELNKFFKTLIALLGILEFEALKPTGNGSVDFKEDEVITRDHDLNVLTCTQREHNIVVLPVASDLLENLLHDAGTHLAELCLIVIEFVGVLIFNVLILLGNRAGL